MWKYRYLFRWLEWRKSFHIRAGSPRCMGFFLCLNCFQQEGLTVDLLLQWHRNQGMYIKHKSWINLAIINLSVLIALEFGLFKTKGPWVWPAAGRRGDGDLSSLGVKGPSGTWRPWPGCCRTRPCWRGRTSRPRSGGGSPPGRSGRSWTPGFCWAL